MFITAVRAERDLGVPSVPFNTLTGHRSCAPEDCGERPAYLAAGAGAGLQASFRRAFTCAFWRLGFRQSGFRHITRISRCAAPDTWARPQVSWHAISLASFRIPVSHQIQRSLLSSLPAARAIQQCASWRTRAVKPSAQPTLVRTQHLPHQREQPLTSDYLVGGCSRPGPGRRRRGVLPDAQPAPARLGVVGWLASVCGTLPA
jgi:hypothetical protein